MFAMTTLREIVLPLGLQTRDAPAAEGIRNPDHPHLGSEPLFEVETLAPGLSPNRRKVSGVSSAT
jgi:hypothetical protein